MSPIPYLLLIALVALFLNDYVVDKAVLAAVCLIAIVALSLYWLVSRRAGPGFHGFSLLKLVPLPVLDFAGRKYCALALSLATPSDQPATRLDNELNYERLCRFSETVASLGIPLAYITYAGQMDSPFLRVSKEYRAQSIMVTWVSSENESSLREVCEGRSKQLESVCRVIFPNAQLSILDHRSTTLLLSSPMPYALDKISHHTVFQTELQPTAVPPPSLMASPSIAIPIPEPEVLNGDGPFIGWAFYNGKKAGALSFHLCDVQRHIALFGTTGSGKSTTAISLAFRLGSAGISVMILDWHGEHSERVIAAGGKAFHPGSTVSGLTVNPLSCPSSKDMSFQVEFITDVFAQIFQFSAPQSYMFRETLKACYRSKLNPTLSDLIKELGLMPIRSSWDHETRMALMRRLKVFTEGACGLATNGDDSVFREELFKGLVCIDLSFLKDVNSRAIFANLLLKLVYDRAVGREHNHLEHVTFIDEAQNIIPPRRPEQPRSIGERILAELRKYGEGVAVITQFPSSISLEVLKNSSIRIIHSIRSGEDLKIIEDATSLTPRQASILPALSIGEAIVNLPYRSSNVFVKVTPDPLATGGAFTGEASRACHPSQASLSN